MSGSTSSACRARTRPCGASPRVETSRSRSAVRHHFGLTGESYTHNFLELGLDAGQVDAIALSHGHVDHYGGLGGFLKTYRRRMKKNLAFYGGSDHFLPRYNERNSDRVYIGRLDREELERYDLDVRVVVKPRSCRKACS